MHYSYILLSEKLHKFYFGYTEDLKQRLDIHNTRSVYATKLGVPWRLVWYGAFDTASEARDFERYLKTGSGKAFAYKRLVSVALARDFAAGRIGSTKQ